MTFEEAARRVKAKEDAKKLKVFATLCFLLSAFLVATKLLA